MINTFDEFTEKLFNEAKYLFELANETDNIDIERTYLHASLLVGMSALEAYINSISMELCDGFELNIFEKAMLSEKEIRFNNGEFQTTNHLKMVRIINRIELIYCKFSHEHLNDSATWFSDIKQAIQLRNDLVHPKNNINITKKQIKNVLNSILSTIDELYLAVYKTHVPILNYGLQSTIES